MCWVQGHCALKQFSEVVINDRKGPASPRRPSFQKGLTCACEWSLIINKEDLDKGSPSSITSCLIKGDKQCKIIRNLNNQQVRKCFPNIMLSSTEERIFNVGSGRNQSYPKQPSTIDASMICNTYLKMTNPQNYSTWVLHWEMEGWAKTKPKVEHVQFTNHNNEVGKLLRCESRLSTNHQLQECIGKEAS